jgi:hypothetical protein
MWRVYPLLINDSVNTFPREPTRARIGRLLLDNGSLNTPKTIQDGVFVRLEAISQGSSKGAVSCSWGSCCLKLRQFSWRIHLRKLFSRLWSSSGDGSLRWFRRNGKKRIRLRQEDFMGNLKLQWDCYKSVARIRPVKTEDPSACATVDCKVCKSAISLYYL